jgi:hypothetical protein
MLPPWHDVSIKQLLHYRRSRINWCEFANRLLSLRLVYLDCVKARGRPCRR